MIGWDPRMHAQRETCLALGHARDIGNQPHQYPRKTIEGLGDSLAGKGPASVEAPDSVTDLALADPLSAGWSRVCSLKLGST